MNDILARADAALQRHARLRMMLFPQGCTVRYERQQGKLLHLDEQHATVELPTGEVVTWPNLRLTLVR
jgi:hypothetical protein